MAYTLDKLDQAIFEVLPFYKENRTAFNSTGRVRALEDAIIRIFAYWNLGPSDSRYWVIKTVREAILDLKEKGEFYFSEEDSEQ